MLLGLFQVTRQRNTTTFCASLLLLLIALTWWLFGLVWSVILCAVSGLCYCTTSYLCYRPEANEWRRAITEWYDKLFVWGLNYSHHSPAFLQGNHKNDTSRSHNLRSNGSTPSLQEFQTRGELSPGVMTLGDARPPQPQAAEQEGDGRGGATGDEEVQPMKKCHKEAQKIIQLIMRDFVQSWYTDVTNDSEFPEDAQKILEHIALEINIRFQQVDLEEAVVEVLELILPYLEVLNEAGIRNYSGMELFDVNTEMCVKQFEANPNVAHFALKSASHERRHYRQVLDALLQCAVPPEYSRCDVACTFIREVLIANIVNPLFNLLCDPAFLYEAIPIILTKASPEKIYKQLDDIDQENEELDRISNRGRLIYHITGGSHGRMKRRFHTSSGRFGHSAHYGNLPSPSVTSRRGHGKFPRPHSIATFPNMQRTSSGIYEPSSWLTHSSQATPSHNGTSELTAESTYPPSMSPKRFSSPAARMRSRDHLSYHNTMVENDEFPEEEEEEEEEEVDSYDHIMDGEFAVVELSPIYIERHVRVDTGDTNPHIAYIFKFPKWMLLDAELTELGVLDSDTHLEGMKRYSEFCRFHNALMASPYSASAKGLTLPKKRNLTSLISKLPFTSSDLDATVIHERKQGLEKYLQSVSSVEAIIGSELFRQFLRSGVKDLKEANVVNPNRNKKQNRMSFLGKVKGDGGQKAEPIPKKALEDVVSSYLNTHLPLPCQVNSLHSIKRRPPLSHQSTSVPPSPTKLSSSDLKRSAARHSRTLLTSALPEHSPAYSRASSGSATSSLGGSMKRSQSEHTSLRQMEPYEHPSITLTDGADGKNSQCATEAVYDVNLPDGGESILSSHNSLQRMMEEEEEEAQTIGSRSSSSLSTGSSRRPSIPRSHTTTPVLSDFPLLHATQAPQKSETTTRQQKQKRQQQSSDSVILPRLQSLAYKFLVYMHQLISWIIFIIHKGLEPYSKRNLQILMQIEKKQSPLTNALFCLGSEASARHCPRLWACAQNTQLSLLVLAGGGVERFLWKELKLVVCDEINWTRALYTLRHTLWPGGTFMKSSRKKVSEAELEQLKRKAADAFKKFMPNFFPHIVGDKEYDRAVVHSLDFLRNPRLTRHFLLRVVDLVVVKIIPEITDKKFQKQLSQLRTRQSTHPSAN